MPDMWGVISIIVTWALYLGTLGAAGTVFCTSVFSLLATRKTATAFAGLGLLAAITSFMLKGVALTGNASGMTDPVMLGLLWSTQNGTALMLQVIGLALILTGLTAVRLPGSIIALAAFVSTGHIADQSNFLLSALLFLHLAAAAFWIGILIPLKRALLSPIKAADLGHRFGKMASLAVPALIVAGVILSYVLTGSIAGLVTTWYGLWLIVKVSLVAMLLTLAAANKLRFVPKLVAGDATAAFKLSRSISAEWIAISLILAVTAIITTTQSPPHL